MVASKIISKYIDMMDFWKPKKCTYHIFFGNTLDQIFHNLISYVINMRSTFCSRNGVDKTDL